MLNDKKVTSVTSIDDEASGDSSTNNSAFILTDELEKRGVRLTLGNNLKGGVVSEVMEAKMQDGTPVVVKHTSDWTSDNPTVLAISKEGHNIDTQLLMYLGDTTNLRVPKVLHHFGDIHVTVLEDLRVTGFTLVSELILNKSLSLNCAENIGRDLAIMQESFAKHPEFLANESGWEIFYDRAIELSILYPNDTSRYDELQHRFTTQNQQLSAVDTHPKNMFVDSSGNVAWIDFGRSTWCDSAYALPNCMAHFVAYSLAGYITVESCAVFLQSTVSAYGSLLPVDEKAFCTYLALELLHRFAGKYIAGINSPAQKTRLLEFGLDIHDKNITSIIQLVDLLTKQ